MERIKRIVSREWLGTIRINLFDSVDKWKISAVFSDGERRKTKIFLRNCEIYPNDLFYFGKRCNDKSRKIRLEYTGMAKRQHKRTVCKAHYPGLRRITLADGSRAWVWNGKIYKSLAELPALKS